MYDKEIGNAATATIGVLERYGWIRGSFGGRWRGFCLVGAIEEVMPIGTLSSEEEKQKMIFMDRIRDKIQYRGLTHWNDYLAEGKEHVMRVLTEVRDEARQAAAAR